MNKQVLGISGILTIFFYNLNIQQCEFGLPQANQFKQQKMKKAKTLLYKHFISWITLFLFSSSEFRKTSKQYN